MVRAFITGISALSLSPEERAFIREAQPWGFILFKRNVDTPAQVADLVAELRSEAGRGDAPVLIDQEGGRVQRLGPPHWPRYPAGAAFAALYARESSKGLRAAFLANRLIAADLDSLGITVDCLPLADLPVAGADAVIGDRAYGESVEQVVAIARAVTDGLEAGGVLPVLKHIPGHGRATADSHLRLPVVDTAADELDLSDFATFRQLRDLPMAMTAHVVFSAIDPVQPATTSATMIAQVIRRSIGFQGLLMSDDLSMNALAGSLSDRAKAAFSAGCDVALHCNGNLGEMRQVASASPVLAGAALDRAVAALASRRPAQDIDLVAARDELDRLLSELEGASV